MGGGGNPIEDNLNAKLKTQNAKTWNVELIYLLSDFKLCTFNFPGSNHG
jgi:hypothetical protein